ncbi:NAD(P)H-dependent oxidoreductase [Nicoliella spurrieriana]|uniref:NAD(P)H-dependent oxidoreductase n=1 Tax=Nicoliella spurrieriana TaxID=2925830 RepID=A0A976RS95_9LACO|nr:NADPH-dependent FMN reductase [Nicoliella spurrieriana]UQS86884.1 NAD(P)H-dependent oxidoreductase [Nicoliella spurrieriana]
MSTINVILGTSRKAALGKNLLNYMAAHKDEYEKMTGDQFNFMELGSYNLPFFYEDLAPLNNPDRTLKENEQKWVDDMKNADGYIFMTPEYNHSIPAVLKNGIDYLAGEIGDKPALIITYSNNSRGGQFGGNALSPIINRLGSFVLPKSVVIGNVQDNFAADGAVLPDAPSGEYYGKKLTQTAKRIAFYTDLLKDHPFKG